MCTTVALSGYSFCGVDTPAFFKDPPSVEFVVRGYQAGCIFPFYRAHSDRKTKRREPYLFKSPFKEAMIRAVETRYELILYYYTAFHKHRISGQPVLRPVINYESGEVIVDQVHLGDSLMFKAIVEPEVEEAQAVLQEFEVGAVWYQRHGDLKIHPTEEFKFDCEIKIGCDVPIFVKGRSIIPEYYDICKQG
jgi:alpha-glucosidase (family GH31 glycosyl hydrolase)